MKSRRLPTIRLPFVCLLSAIAAFGADSSVTFNKDVLPILQANCQSCHRPGEVAPMSLMTYNEARPWAKALKAAVVTQRMPPWFADPKYGHFANDRRLSQKDIATISVWADSGAVEGDAKDKPAPVSFNNGWNIKPDLVIEMPNEYKIPATGTINWQYMVVKGNIKQDVWVTAAEMRPGNSKVLHHGKVWVRPPDSHWMEDAVPGVPYEAGMGKKSVEEGNDIIGKFNPGLGPQSFEIDGSAKLVPTGSDFVFELHYTTTGQPTSDRSRVGMVFAKSAPQTRYYLSPGTPLANNLMIPPGAKDQEVVSEVTTGIPSKLVYIQPHMHVRGKDYELQLLYPTGERQIAFKGKFDFEWQLGYQLKEPLTLPVGTRIRTIAHFDNSPNNKYNPDPSKAVYWGGQNWDEMQSSFLGFVVNMDQDLSRLLKASGVSLLPRGKPGPTLEALNQK